MDPDDTVGVVITSVYSLELTNITGFGGAGACAFGFELSVFDDVAVDEEEDKEDSVRHCCRNLGLGWTVVKFLGFTCEDPSLIASQSRAAWSPSPLTALTGRMPGTIERNCNTPVTHL